MAVVGSKSHRITQLLRRVIANGEFSPGDRFYSQRALSEKYNVAYATSGKVLDELVRAGLLRREQGKGTFVAAKTERTLNIGYLYNSHISTDYPWFTKLLAGVERNRKDNNYCLSMRGIPAGSVSLADAEALLEDIRKGVLDGLLVSSRLEDPVVLELEQLGASVVFIESRHPHLGLHWPRVGIDHFYVGYQATKHLSGQGYGRIAFISGPAPLSTALRSYVSGYDRARSELGLGNFRSITHCEWSAEDAYEKLLRLYPQLRPDAVVCADDVLALGAIRARNRLGLSNADLGVVGVGNLLAVRDDLELTTFETNVERVGELAMARLLDLIAGRHVDVLNEFVEPQIIVRRSSLRSEIKEDAAARG